jgi:hypothetical protein
MFPYRWTCSTVFSNLRWGWYTAYYGICSLFAFFKAVWRFNTCDFAGLLVLIETATRLMRDHHRYNGVTVDAPKVARQLTVVSELCRRLREDNYLQNAGYGDGEAWSRMTEFRRKQVAKHACKMQQQDADYLGKMFKSVNTWWD